MHQRALTREMPTHSSTKMDGLQGDKTVFYAHSCKINGPHDQESVFYSSPKTRLHHLHCVSKHTHLPALNPFSVPCIFLQGKFPQETSWSGNLRVYTRIIIYTYSTERVKHAMRCLLVSFCDSEFRYVPQESSQMQYEPAAQGHPHQTCDRWGEWTHSWEHLVLWTVDTVILVHVVYQYKSTQSRTHIQRALIWHGFMMSYSQWVELTGEVHLERFTFSATLSPPTVLSSDSEGVRIFQS